MRGTRRWFGYYREVVRDIKNDWVHRGAVCKLLHKISGECLCSSHSSAWRHDDWYLLSICDPAGSLMAARRVTSGESYDALPAALEG
jgi:hypothetical protein